MNIGKYLNRIKYKGSLYPHAETLKELHIHHLLTIPFEDLDIHLKKPLSLSLDDLYDKVILNNRGGFCYELNVLFSHLLKSLGFNCILVSSRIYNENESLGPEFDHMSIIVQLEEKWLVDVGYGDLFMEPMKFIHQHTHKDWFKSYRLNKSEQSTYELSESKDGVAFQSRYQIDTRPRQIREFDQQCQFKQYSTESYFVKNKICTLPRLNGRITIRNDKLIKRNNDKREEYPITSEEQMNQLLKDEFGIIIPKLKMDPIIL